MGRSGRNHPQLLLSITLRTFRADAANDGVVPEDAILVRATIRLVTATQTGFGAGISKRLRKAVECCYCAPSAHVGQFDVIE